MLILILINVHYLHNDVFSFGEGSNGQNHFLSHSHHPRFPIPLLDGFSPLKNTGDGSIYISPKVRVNDNPEIQCTSIRILKTLAVTPLRHIV